MAKENRNTIMDCNFTLKHYEEILKLALNKGYHFLLFQQKPDKYKKVIYLRHDIDISPDNVIKLARIENKLKIRSTYFYLLHDIFYNILEKQVFADIQTVQKLGHQIGLHFDENFYIGKDNNFKNIKKRIIEDLNLMENIIDTKVIAVSFHNPKVVLGKEIKNKRFINIYSNEYFKEIKYLSDSLQNWRERCLCKLLEEEKYNKMQILIHPLWWTKKGWNNQRILNDYIFQKCSRMNKYLGGTYLRKYKKLPKNLCPLFHKDKPTL